MLGWLRCTISHKTFFCSSNRIMLQSNVVTIKYLVTGNSVRRIMPNKKKCLKNRYVPPLLGLLCIFTHYMTHPNIAWEPEKYLNCNVLVALYSYLSYSHYEFWNKQTVHYFVRYCLIIIINIKNLFPVAAFCVYQIKE